MDVNRFLNQREDNWERLEGLLSMIRGSGLGGLSRLEVRELGELYRRAAADLAIAREEYKISQRKQISSDRMNYATRVKRIDEIRSR